MTQSIQRLSVDTLGQILSFADNTDAAKVCRSFHAATDKAMQRVCRQLSMSERGFGEGVEVAIFEERVRGLNAKITRVLEQGPTVLATSTYKFYQDRLGELRESCLREPAGAVRDARMCALLATALRLQDYFDRVIDAIDRGDEHWQAFFYLADLLGGHDLAPDRLTGRFRDLIRTLPQDVSAARRLEALHAEQRAAARLYEADLFANLEQEDHHSFSLDRFKKAEAIVLRSEIAKDRDFERFWMGISPTLQPLLGANPPSTPKEKRTWVQEAQNAPLLNQVRWANFHRIRHIPPEIGRLRNLNSLSYGTLNFWLELNPNPRLTLSREMENLPNLTSLNLEGSRLDAAAFAVIGRMPQLTRLSLGSCELQQIPQEIGQLLHLTYLDLTHNQIAQLPPFLLNLRHLNCLALQQNPIRSLPDALYRMLERGDSCCVGFDVTQRSHIRIDRENLTEIPFRLWFQEEVSVPYITLLPELIRHDPANNAFVDCLGCIANVVLTFALNAPIALLNVAIFLTNWILQDLVEPIITLFRDLFGYSRMVRVEPQEEQQ